MGEGGDGDGGPLCGCLLPINSLFCPGLPSTSSSGSRFRSIKLGIEISTEDKGHWFGDIGSSHNLEAALALFVESQLILVFTGRVREEGPATNTSHGKVSQKRCCGEAKVWSHL